MKKLIVTIIPLFALMAIMSCKQQEIVSYEYKSTTMLGTRTVTISQDSVVSAYNGRANSKRTARATSTEEWSELKTAVQTVKLKEINDLPSPTNKRQTDAAPFGMLMIQTKDTVYRSASFDGFDANEALMPVMVIIEKIAAAKM